MGLAREDSVDIGRDESIPPGRGRVWVRNRKEEERQDVEP
jgi:hypothetical protein